MQLFLEKIILRIFNIFLAGTLSYCNSEPSQHYYYAKLGHLFYAIRALNARKTRENEKRAKTFARFSREARMP